jgi:hypothetical protein
MRQTELILFIVVMLINGGIALYKKHKQREAERAAKSLENLATTARAEAKSARPARAPAPPRAKPAPIRATPAPVPAPASTPTTVPPPDRATTMPQVVAELERRARERLATGAPASDRVFPATATPRAVPPAKALAVARIAPVHAAAPIGVANIARSRRTLGTRAALRNAIIASEVLGRPRADRPLGA